MTDVLEVKSVVSSGGGGEPFVKRWLDRQIARGKREGVFTVTTDLTPELAELLLSNNPDNRNISLHKAVQYARDIDSGRWEHNGEPVIVADTGELNDGQHRCEAVIRSGRAITTQMTFGISRSTRGTVDVGLKRAIGQHLQMAGYVDCNHLGHAVALIVGFEAHGTLRKLKIDARPTTAEMLEWVANHEMGAHIKIGNSVGPMLGVSNGMVAAISYILHKIDNKDAETFLESLKLGDGLPIGNPILSVRNQLIGNKGKKNMIPGDEKAALIIKAWNIWRSGKTRVRAISWNSTGGEKFPIPE